MSAGRDETLLRALRRTRYGIDLATAVLLVTRRITTSGIFVVPEGFYLGATGPILGGVRLEGGSRSATAALAAVDILVAVLLIIQAIRVTGPYITSQRFFIVFSGPIFGIKEIVGARVPDPRNRAGADAVRDYLKRCLVER